MAFRNHSNKQQMRAFAQRVIRFRVIHGLSQNALAKAMHTCKRTVQNIEKAHFIARSSTIVKFNHLVQTYAQSEQAKREMRHLRLRPEATTNG